MKRYIKPLNEFIAADPVIKPGTPTVVPPPVAPPRPSTPRPRIRPGEREKEHPMAKFNDVMDQFFAELEKAKDTPAGKSMIKKLHRKYVKD
jgi:hypothetical protein